MLDEDYAVFAFAPKKLFEPFVEDRKKHPKEQGPLNEKDMAYFGLRSLGWPEKRSREIAGKLFVHMTNFVACNHGWYTGGDLVPFPYLDVEGPRIKLSF